MIAWDALVKKWGPLEAMNGQIKLSGIILREKSKVEYDKINPE